MPRIRRVVRPGALIHIIVRFVNHEFLLDQVEERAEYLRRARLAFLRTDWVALSYALMSTHTHFGAIAGRQPFADWSRPLHTGFVGWLNPRRGRLGAAIANRPATYEVAPALCARLIAYHHNNPVRAGVVDSADASDWTSHHAYTSGNSPDWWPGSLRRLAQATCRESRIDHSQLVSPHRARPIVNARRVFLLLALAAGRTLTEAAAYLNVSIPAASKSVSKADADTRRRAHSIAESLGVTEDLG